MIVVIKLRTVRRRRLNELRLHLLVTAATSPTTCTVTSDQEEEEEQPELEEDADKAVNGCNFNRPIFG